jgi:hypothetical protein
VGCAAKATKKDNAIRARTGTALDEKTGADVNRANVRKNGHINGDSHPAICASEKVITAA